MLYLTSCPSIGILNIGLATTLLSSIRKYSNIRSFELELFDVTKEQLVSTLDIGKVWSASKQSKQ